MWSGQAQHRRRELIDRSENAAIADGPTAAATRGRRAGRPGALARGCYVPPRGQSALIAFLSRALVFGTPHDATEGARYAGDAAGVAVRGGLNSAGQKHSEGTAGCFARRVRFLGCTIRTS
jgi:hypothetical protein